MYDSRRTATGAVFSVRPLRNDGSHARAVIDRNSGGLYCNPISDIGIANQCDIYQNGSRWIHRDHDKIPDNQFHRYGQYPGEAYVLDLILGNNPVAQ
ncbi:hypothetical protein OG250_24980 [Streptomyces sp. NBC_00487]|uniref:hypothetical protein n=1 Tax=unclassified Streptomyces TaxID=2593676 RepID=UPI002E16B62F|nr:MULTISPECIES: hypothetical protein [unclassified Streptomyces]